MKPIVHIPAIVLSTPAKKVSVFDRRLSKVISEMKETLVKTTNPKGVGLAAPQIGIPWRLFVIKPTEKAALRVFINPEITKRSEPSDKPAKSDSRLEGCLSIPAIWGRVSRSETVTLTYQDESGAKHTEEISGFPAVIIQHETDHLNGILFTQRVIEQNSRIFQTTVDQNGKEVLEEVKI